MRFNPKVSIVIPVYNGKNYLQEAIDSALAQTYKNIEIIVVNDGSNDGGDTENIARSYGGKIRYFYKENGGVASALNLGIQQMTGDYFSWLSHDDLYYPEKLQCQMDFLRQYDDKNVVLYSDFEFIDGESRSLGVCVLERKVTERPLRAILSTLIHGCSTVVAKAAFDSVGLFCERHRTTQDYQMWLRIHKGGFGFFHVPRVLIKSRIHPAQGQVKMRDINRLERKQFYSCAFDELHEEVTRDAKAIFEVLASRGINLPVSVVKRKRGNKNSITWRFIAGYKYKVYSRKILNRLTRTS